MSLQHSFAHFSYSCNHFKESLLPVLTLSGLLLPFSQEMTDQVALLNVSLHQCHSLSSFSVKNGYNCMLLRRIPH